MKFFTKYSDWIKYEPILMISASDNSFHKEHKFKFKLQFVSIEQIEEKEKK